MNRMFLSVIILWLCRLHDPYYPAQRMIKLHCGPFYFILILILYIVAYTNKSLIFIIPSFLYFFDVKHPILGEGGK